MGGVREEEDAGGKQVSVRERGEYEGAAEADKLGTINMKGVLEDSRGES